MATTLTSPARFQRHKTRNYSRFVSMMKFLLPFAATILIILVIIWPQLDTDDLRFKIGFAAIDAGISADPSMLNPRFVGSDSDDQPYAITADLARSLDDEAKRVELAQPKADITLGDGTWIVLTAETGVFAHEEKKLDLEGSVNLFHDSGYEFRTEKTAIDLDTGVASGNAPVSGQGPFGVLAAEGYKLVSKGKTIYFSGKSKLILHTGGGR